MGKRWVKRGAPNFIEPGSPEHARYISPSKVASICGVSRWESAYTLWLRMKGRISPKPPLDIFDTGHAMELAMAELWRLRHPGWRLSPGEVQYRTEDYGFPALATIDRRASRGRSFHIVEMKLARDLHESEQWGDPDLSGDAPADIVLQIIAQQLLTGLREPAHLMVMGPYYKEREYTVEFDETVADWMVGLCAGFYDSLRGDTPPPLDDSISTYEAVRELHPDIDGTAIQVAPELIEQICHLRSEIGPLEDKLRGHKTELLDWMGQAQTAKIGTTTVARRQPHFRGGVSLVIL